VVDTCGLLLVVLVTGAHAQTRDAARLLLWALRTCFPTVRLLWADGGYSGQLVDWATTALTLTVQIVRKLAWPVIFRRAHGFHSAESALALVMLPCGPITLQLPNERTSNRREFASPTGWRSLARGGSISTEGSMPGARTEDARTVVTGTAWPTRLSTYGGGMDKGPSWGDRGPAPRSDVDGRFYAGGERGRSRPMYPGTAAAPPPGSTVSAPGAGQPPPHNVGYRQSVRGTDRPAPPASSERGPWFEPREYREPSSPDHLATGTTGRARRLDASGWHWLLIVPIALPLSVPLYNRLSPTAFGLPFFYWWQLGLSVVATTVIGIVHAATRTRR
jgi:Protein of unknown function (DUF3311)